MAVLSRRLVAMIILAAVLAIAAAVPMILRVDAVKSERAGVCFHFNSGRDACVNIYPD